MSKIYTLLQPPDATILLLQRNTSKRKTSGNAVEIPRMSQNVRNQPCCIALALCEALEPVALVSFTLLDAKIRSGHGNLLRDIAGSDTRSDCTANVVLRRDVHIAHHLQRQSRNRIISVSQPIVLALGRCLVRNILRRRDVADPRLAKRTLRP